MNIVNMIFVLCITTSSLFSMEQNPTSVTKPLQEPQVSTQLQETKPTTKKVIKISSEERIRQVAHVCLMGFIFYYLTSKNYLANDNLYKIILSSEILLSIPTVMFNELDADEYYIIQMLKGCKDFGWVYLLLRDNPDLKDKIYAAIISLGGMLELKEGMQHFLYGSNQKT